jgi:beta-lactamase regulating signal transducer with metallopeptidase domain
MSLLARFGPGDAVTALVIVCLVQTTVVILAAAVCSGTMLRHRAPARHGLWLGNLMLALLSPAVAGIVDRSGLTLWAIPLRIPGSQALRNADAHGTTHRAHQSDSSGTNANLNDVSILVESEPERPVAAMPGVEQGRVETDRTVAREVDRPKSALLGGLTLLWAVGAVVGLARIAAGWRKVAMIVRSARVLDPVRHGPTLERVRDALGLGTLPPVVVSPEVRGPVAVGLLRPRVLLPEGLAESIASAALRDVLIHEYAHVVRLDAWVGLLQRLAGVLFWPHPLVHYANGQLTRAREEVCDNYVLRCGDGRSYARTLLALTEQRLPLRALGPGLGLLGARWTLADRITGLLDERRILMIHMTFRTKIALAAAFATTGLTVATLHLDRSAAAAELKVQQTIPKATAPVVPPNAVWNLEGIVVDEQGKPVAEAVVHARDEADPIGTKTGADGAFTLWFGSAPLYVRELVATTEGGAQMGLTRFEPPRHFAAQGPVRLVIKPARTVTVHVKDAAGAPVPGAAVEAFEFAYQFQTTTGPDGSAILRVPVDARSPGVVGLKSGAGFDYFENYSTTPPIPTFEFPPLPAEITLTLDGASTVRIKVIDASGRPVPGVLVKPFRPRKAGKIATIEIAHGATTFATTDEQGIARFDWLPKSVSRDNRPSGGVTFFLEPPPGFSPLDPVRSVPGGPIELTARLVRSARLTGTVRFPDGRPARRILIIACLTSGGWIPAGARTDDEGRYVFNPIKPGFSRMIGVYDQDWASSSMTSDILREGQEQGGLDFTLIKGTLVHGRVTVGPEHRPAAGTRVLLAEEGGPLPKELRSVRANTYRLPRITYTDAQGNYQLRVARGRYRLQTEGSDDAEQAVIEVKNEADLVYDLAAQVPAIETFIKGVVIESTALGDRPVAGALAFRWPVYSASRTDEHGTFMVERPTGETIFYAYCPDRRLAGFTRVLPADTNNVKVLVSQTGTVTGRVVDSNGKARANQRIGVRLTNGKSRHYEFNASSVVTDEQGRFTYKDGPVGSAGEFVAYHRNDPTTIGPLIDRGARARTVVQFEIRDLDPVQIADLVVPADRPPR